MKKKKIAAGVIFDRSKILLIKRKFDPHKNKWAPPGGHIDKSINESLEECCIREVKEETGLDIVINKKIDILKESNSEIHLFLCSPLSNELIINEEVLNINWVDFSKINELDLIPSFREIILKII